jgi:hypothetical protein
VLASSALAEEKKIKKSDDQMRRIGGAAAINQSQVTLMKIPGTFYTVAEAAQHQQEEAKNRGGQGPSIEIIQLAEYVDIGRIDEFDGVTHADLCRLSTDVYPDVNEDSGIYYYYPQWWYLHFEPDEGGYHLQIDYKASQGESNEVLLVAHLTPGYDTKDVDFLGAMLKEYLRDVKGKQNADFKLLSLPASIEAEFEFSKWDIGEVTINAVEPDTDNIHLSISADVPTKELVTNTLIDEGLSGTVLLQPEDLGELQTLRSTLKGIAVIKLGEIAGGPSLRWPQRTSGGKAGVNNQWPFDMRLDYLAYLYEKPNGGLELRGWDLGGEVLGPGDTAQIKNADLNTEFHSNRSVATRFIASLKDVDATGRAVIEHHTGGVGLYPQKNLSILISDLGIFDQYSIFRIAVEVRSAHFDPEGREVVSRTYLLDGSEEVVEVDTLYLWEDPSGSDLFQYRVSVVTSDGVPHEDRGWRRPGSSGLTAESIFVGSDMVEEVLAE